MKNKSEISILMKYFLSIIAIGCFIVLSSCVSENQKATAQKGDSGMSEETKPKKVKNPVLVELFTSEG